MKFNKRGETGSEFTTKHIIYWILIAVIVVVIFIIIKGIINKLLVLY